MKVSTWAEIRRLHEIEKLSRSVPSVGARHLLTWS